MPEFVSEDRSDRTRRTIRTGRLQLRFSWIVDRWHHEISLRSGDEWIPAALSDEEGVAPVPSGRVTCPAYQQFHYQEGDARSVALLVGQSGPHHFSASFEIEDHDAASRIVVDVADRVRADEPSLACTYVIPQRPSTAIVEEPDRVVWNVAGRGRLALSGSGPGARAARVTFLGNTTNALLSRVRIAEDADRSASSLRCRYHWTFEHSDDPV